MKSNLSSFANWQVTCIIKWNKLLGEELERWLETACVLLVSSIVYSSIHSLQYWPIYSWILKLYHGSQNLWDLTFKATKATSLVDHDFFFISDSNYPLKRYLDRKIRTRVIETLLLWLAVKICPFQAYPKIVTESACSHSPQTWECFSTIINMQCNEKIMWKSSKSFAAKLFKIGSYKCLQYKFKVITRWLALAYMSLKSHPICF